MDARLTNRTREIDKQIDIVFEAESSFLTLEAVKDHKLAALASTFSEEKSESAKDRRAKATIDWKMFKEALANSEAEFHRQKHRLELKNKEYDGEHLTLKVESSAIRRQA